MSFKFVVLFVLAYLLSSISDLHGALSEYNVMDTGAKCDVKTNDNKNLQLTGIANGLLHNITSLDSKMFHINFEICRNMNLKNIGIDASIMSLNTDGIHIGQSNRVNITEVDIKTGDDCTSLGDGSQHINIENVTCDLGHGISMGSLAGIMVNNWWSESQSKIETLANTTNGVRVKTWPNSYEGIAYGLHFEDIIMNNVSNPIITYQNYCLSNLCKIPSRVRISDILFKDVQGTSATEMAIISNLHGAIFEYNVMDNGAKCDGKANDSKAFMSAKREACKSTGPSTMVIPARNCMFGPVEFDEPCKAAITFKDEALDMALTHRSLGKYRGEQPVVGITVRNCTITNIANGVRKSMPCQNVKLRDIGLKYVDMDKNVRNAISQCSNCLGRGEGMESCKRVMPTRVLKIRDP
ncbi:hypothetical protein Cgig2_001062 [Carnegiea gigantea]|uniref:Glycoside hydrolase family 28 n=1 Tax=Carnegiea gigantea TaxID=171969 RepID=A0A9Q1K253_9CARY|nr:hypothetical protein Cgig2_001062 [Carnegiea gigantea]